MDWEKFGQAFQGGANVLAGGLMDKYQRKKDLEDYEKKRQIESQIQTGEREAEHTFQIGKQSREAWLESIKQDFKNNPELIPHALRAEQGDEESRRILSIYAGARYQMDQKTPLTSEQISELQNLPPQTRHTIISRHLTTLNEETKRRADLEGVLARTEREKATTKKALEDTQDYSDLYGDYAVKKKEQEKVTAQKKKDIESKLKEIKSLNDRIGSKQIEATRAEAAKNGLVLRAVDAEIERLKGLRSDAESWVSDLATAEAAGGAEEQTRQKWAAEKTAPPAAPSAPSAIKTESYPVGTRRRNKRTGEIQAWDGTQWKSEK